MEDKLAQQLVDLGKSQEALSRELSEQIVACRELTVALSEAVFEAIPGAESAVAKFLQDRLANALANKLHRPGILGAMEIIGVTPPIER